MSPHSGLTNVVRFYRSRTPSGEGHETIVLDGESLDLETLLDLASGNFKIRLAEDSKANVIDSATFVDRIVKEKRTVYGITTGFGRMADVRVENDEELVQLQYNLLRSHAAGTGPYISREQTRLMLVLRINALAKGRSGIRLGSLEYLCKAFNVNCIPCVPEQGTVGASGDLAPLSHLALAFCGEGDMYHPKTGEVIPATQGLLAADIPPLVLGPKEGLSLINGTQFITALACEAVERARLVFDQSIVIAAMSLEGVRGLTKPFSAFVHAARSHPGQIEVAARLRALLHSKLNQSNITLDHGHKHRVQDAYSFRCIPQVYGPTFETMNFVRSLLTREINSATDNPLIFTEAEETMHGDQSDMGGQVISAGNFHGQYPAMAMDFLGIAMAEIGSITERRIDRMLTPGYNDGLPPFLTPNAGINSGFMIAHCTAAALVSENKGLAHPAVVDTIPTSAGQEDHVSMGGWAARKALKIISNVETVLAVELLAACQALELRKPLTSTEPLDRVLQHVRQKIPAWENDRFMKPDIDIAKQMLLEGEIIELVEKDIALFREIETNNNNNNGKVHRRV